MDAKFGTHSPRSMDCGPTASGPHHLDWPPLAIMVLVIFCVCWPRCGVSTQWLMLTGPPGRSILRSEYPGAACPGGREPAAGGAPQAAHVAGARTAWRPLSSWLC